MFARIGTLCLAALVGGLLYFSAGPQTLADAGDGIVRVESAYPMAETIARLKDDIAEKGIMFFLEVDQAKLAAKAGVSVRPSTLLIFGNPPLGTQFLTANPFSGLDWPVRLLVFAGRTRKSVDGLHGLPLDRRAPSHHQSRSAVQDGLHGDRVRSRRACACRAASSPFAARGRGFRHRRCAAGYVSPADLRSRLG